MFHQVHPAEHLKVDRFTEEPVWQVSPGQGMEQLDEQRIPQFIEQPVDVFASRMLDALAALADARKREGLIRRTSGAAGKLAVARDYNDDVEIVEEMVARTKENLEVDKEDAKYSFYDAFGVSHLVGVGPETPLTVSERRFLNEIVRPGYSAFEKLFMKTDNKTVAMRKELEKNLRDMRDNPNGIPEKAVVEEYAS